MSKQGKGTGKVSHLRSVQSVRIEPPEGWRVQARSGYMRRGDGDGDRLVRLYDVVSWLMKECELPLKKAVDKVCNAVKNMDADAIYVAADPDDYAHASNVPSPFNKFKAKDDTPASNMRAEWLVSARDLAWLVNVPGYPVVFDETKETPFEYQGRHDIRGYAVTHKLAHELWGWGRVVNQQDQATGQPAPAGESEAGQQARYVWTHERRQELLSDLKKAPGKLQKDKIAHVANVWGMGVDNVRKQLKAAKKPNYTTGLGARKST